MKSTDTSSRRIEWFLYLIIRIQNVFIQNTFLLKKVKITDKKKLPLHKMHEAFV